MNVTLLYFCDCPNWQDTDALLASLQSELGFDFDRHSVENVADAERLQFRGSPTVLIDGHDVFAVGDEPVGLSCRVYRTDEGVRGAPTEAQLRELLGVCSAKSDDATVNARR